MSYLLNIIVWEISPLLLENVALRMGNLQVIKIRRGREWTPHSVSLGALIRNRMGSCLYFLFLTYCLWIFMNKCWTRLMRFWLFKKKDLWDFYDEACVPKTFYWCWTNSAASFWNTYVDWFLKDKLLFNQFMNF
jgi:hypothetical protein